MLLPQWQESANRLAKKLDAPTLAALVRSPAKLGKLAAHLSEDPEVASRIGASFAAAAVACTLFNAGWTVKNRVGRPVVLKNGEMKLYPFRDFHSLAEGKLSEGDLVRRLTEAGVQELTVHTTEKN